MRLQLLLETGLLPREVFYVGDIEVIRNPSSADYRQLSDDHFREFPNDRSGDPRSRFTTDADGNRWIWRASAGTHWHVEPLISKKEGRMVGQNEANHRNLLRNEPAYIEYCNYLTSNDLSRADLSFQEWKKRYFFESRT